MSRLSAFFAVALAGLLLMLSMPAMAQLGGSDFLPVDQAFSHHVVANADDTLTITWDIAPGYYLYRHQFKFESEAGPISDVQMLDGETIEDEFFGKSEVYHNQVAVTVDPGVARTLDIAWQGCAEAGLCYPPQHATLDVADYGMGGGSRTDSVSSGNDSSTATAVSNGNRSASASDLGQDQSLAASLSRGNAAWVLGVFFGLGLLLVFTPCVLPMVPILTSLIVGSGASGRRGFVLSVAYVLPMAVTYALLGVAAALAGANLQASMQIPWVLGAFALIFVVLALSMFGVYELQLPAGLRDRLNSASNRQRGGHLGGAAIMGVLSALLVGPCMTAPLAGALLYIADSGDAVLGGSALFALGLGMGAPLIVAGTIGARLLPKPGAWMSGVKVVFGFVLLGTAIWFVQRVVPDNITLGLWGALLVAMGVTLYLLAGHSTTPTRPVPMISRVSGLLLGLWGGLLVVGAAGGAASFRQPLAFTSTAASSPTASSAKSDDFMDRFKGATDLNDLNAKINKASANGQWTLVDFYADWCISCKVIEKKVFGKPQVQTALDKFQLLRPDVTTNGAADRALMQHFNIIGPPTILLIGPDGKERRAARVVGELDADEFLQHLSRAKDKF
ncbi:thiol:disulfide interchange protein DsbD [Rhodanobacter sp. TND4EL1]